MTIRGVNDLCEGVSYQLPTGLRLLVWRKTMIAVRDGEYPLCILAPLDLDRLYTVFPIYPDGRQNAHGELRLTWTRNGTPLPNFGNPTPFIVRDLLPLGEAG